MCKAPELHLIVKFRRGALLECQLFPCFRVWCVLLPSWRYSDASIASSNEGVRVVGLDREVPGRIMG